MHNYCNHTYESTVKSDEKQGLLETWKGRHKATDYNSLHNVAQNAIDTCYNHNMAGIKKQLVN